jgi:hypothetical protein
VVVNPKVAHLEDGIITQVRRLPSLGIVSSTCRTFAGAHQRPLSSVSIADIPQQDAHAPGDDSVDRAGALA